MSINILNAFAELYRAGLAWSMSGQSLVSSAFRSHHGRAPRPAEVTALTWSLIDAL